MHLINRQSFSTLLMMISIQPLWAVEPIPKEEGFSGYINIGLASVTAESNLIAGNRFSDISEKTNNSLADSPDSESDTMGILNGEVSYTFSSSRTQVYFGNQLEDFIQFDFSTLLGVRHELTDKSTLAVSYVFSSVPTEVWEDPYLTNQAREETDRDSSGFRLEWDRIAGTTFGVQYTRRSIEIDDERSGQSLGLSNYDLGLLERDGDVHNLQLHYRHNFQNGHLIQPKITFINRDMDGKSMSSDSIGLGMTHIYNNEQYSFITKLEWANADYDKRNPVFNKTQDDDRIGGSFTVVYKKPFGLKDWNILGTAAYYDSDSNIDFYDTKIKFFSLSALYRF